MKVEAKKKLLDAITKNINNHEYQKPTCSSLPTLPLSTDVKGSHYVNSKLKVCHNESVGRHVLATKDKRWKRNSSFIIRLEPIFKRTY